MDKSDILEEAQAIASLIPKLARGLSAVDHGIVDDLPLAQLRVCGVLSSDGPRPMSGLSRELNVSVSAMTQIADRLERAGLVQRAARGADCRVRCLQLTPQGQTMMSRRQQARVQRALAVVKTLRPEARKKIRAALETLLDACGATTYPRAAAEIEHPGQPDVPPSVASVSP